MQKRKEEAEKRASQDALPIPPEPPARPDATPAPAPAETDAAPDPAPAEAEKRKRSITLDFPRRPARTAPTPAPAVVEKPESAEAEKPKVVDFIVGLGGRDVQPGAFEDMLKLARNKIEKGNVDDYEIYGVRE